MDRRYLDAVVAASAVRLESDIQLIQRACRVSWVCGQCGMEHRETGTLVECIILAQGLMALGARGVAVEDEAFAIELDLSEADDMLENPDNAHLVAEGNAKIDEFFKCKPWPTLTAPYHGAMLWRSVVGD